MIRLCGVILYLLPMLCHAQNIDPLTVEDYYFLELPPTPEAQAMKQYGDVPVDYSTGKPNISIPIYTLVSEDIEIPITLNYDATGIKVNEHSGYVGLKWSLNTGGLLYRTVLGRPDELIGKGWLNNSYSNTDLLSIDPLSWNGFVTLSELATGHATGASNTPGGGSRLNYFDITPDHFSYNLNGSYSSFKFKKDNTLFTYPVNNNKVNIVDLSSLNFIVDNGNGISFKFGGAGYFETKQIASFGASESLGNVNFNPPVWEVPYPMTAKIRNVSSGRGGDLNYYYSNYDPYEDYDDIYFTQGSFTNLVSQSFREVESSTVAGAGWCSCSIPIDNEGCPQYDQLTTNYQVEKLTLKLLDSIVTDDLVLKFNYEKLNDISIHNNILREITVKNKNTGQVIKSIGFEYVVLGSNKYSLKTLMINGQVYSFKYETGVPDYNTFSRDIYEYYNGASNTMLVPYKSNGQNPLDIGKWSLPPGDRGFNYGYLIKGNLTQITYPSGGRLNLKYQVNADTIFNELDEIQDVLYSGGLRVKEIERFDGGQFIGKELFSYSKLSGDRKSVMNMFYQYDPGKAYKSNNSQGTLSPNQGGFEAVCKYKDYTSSERNYWQVSKNGFFYENVILKRLDNSNSSTNGEVKMFYRSSVLPHDVNVYSSDLIKETFVDDVNSIRKRTLSEYSVALVEDFEYFGLLPNSLIMCVDNLSNEPTNHGLNLDLACRSYYPGFERGKDVDIFKYLSKKISKTYDDNGDSLTTEYNYQYESSPYALRKESVKYPDGTEMEREFSFASDFSQLSSSTRRGQAINNLIDHNLSSRNVGSSTILKKDNIERLVEAYYLNYMAEDILIDSVYTTRLETPVLSSSISLPNVDSDRLIFDSKLEIELVNKYRENTLGVLTSPYRLSERQTRSGITNFYWNFNDYLKGSISNVKRRDVSWDNNLRTWSPQRNFNGFGVAEGVFLGEKAFDFSTFGLQVEKVIDQIGQYRFSFWGKNLSGDILVNNVIEETIAYQNTEWKHFSFLFEFQEGDVLKLNLNGFMDDVLLVPSDAKLTRFVHGTQKNQLSRIIDANGKIDFFEYDNQQRLKSILDHNKNTISKYDYHFRTE